MRNSKKRHEDKGSMDHLKDAFYKTPAASPWEFTGFVAEVPLTEEEAESYEDTVGAEVEKSMVKELVGK